MDSKVIGQARPANRRLQININQLEYAIAALDYGSFRRAAEAFSIKQSTLSRSVQLLEHALGAPIFERRRSGVRATPIGRRFLRMAGSIIEQLETLATIARPNDRGEAGCLVVGFCTSLTAGNLRATLLDFKTRYPQVELAIMERSRAELVTALRNGGVDVHVITGESRLSDCKMVPLWSERILVVLPNNHSLAMQEVIYWTDLRDQTVLLSRCNPGDEFEALLNAKLLVENERPRIERHDVSRGIINSLITMRLGISLVLESDIGANFSDLVYRELRDGTGPSRVSFFAAWREDSENPALANFLKLLFERYPFLPEG